MFRYVHDDHTLSPPAHCFPAVSVFKYRCTRSQLCPFAHPNLSALKDYLHTHFGTSDFLFFQHGKRSTHSLVAAPIELRIPLHGGSLLHVKGIFGTCHVTLPVPLLVRCSPTFFLFILFRTSIYSTGSSHQIRHQPHVPIYVLGRLRGGMKANKHQSTPPDCWQAQTATPE